jgi:DNA-binding CsgD family transcriptional regulator
MLFNPAQRRFDDAVSDLRELGRRQEAWGMRRPSPPWRSTCALALLGAGDAGAARELAGEELEIAREWNTPKAIALATRAVALADEGERSIELLGEAVGLLEGTPWRLDLARARVDLGAAQRRAGMRRLGRESLARAMDEAHACGAIPLAERAAEELRASGARPRRRAVSGLDALTPSERRVADLAAAGRTNREIAQELFVTMATVETHLTRVYRKLDLAGRTELAGALPDEPAELP